MYSFNIERRRILKKYENNNKYIVYWMYRDQRINENWSLIYAINKSIELNKKLIVIFIFNLEIEERFYKFIVNNLKGLSNKCKSLNINFHVLAGNVFGILKKYDIHTLIVEQFPIILHKNYVKKLMSLNINITQVDSHNVVPVWFASDKQEFSARTIRNKLLTKYVLFNDEFPDIVALKDNVINDVWNTKNLIIYKTLNTLDSLIGDYDFGMKKFKTFIDEHLEEYESSFNDIDTQTTQISPWIHFGMISAQRCMKILEPYNAPRLKEQFFIRRELSDNFCFYGEYDTMNSFPNWCILNIKEHINDKREILFSDLELENCQTNDQIWNTLQSKMKLNGYLHGYERLYWAKQLIYWKESVEQSIRIAFYLNDKYFMDGRDPIGYVNILWCLVGLHDRPFKNKFISGKVRSISNKKFKKKNN